MRKVAKPKETRPHGLYTAREVSAVAIQLDELPHLTFYGRTLKEVKGAIQSELTRIDPQGFSVAYDTTGVSDRH